MGKVIAVAGKGGTGKTTLCGLTIRYLLEKGLTPVLALDADPNANLNEILGVKVESTIGDIREDVIDKVPPGMSKDEYMELKLEESLVEEESFDLLVMGRPEGPGCYCFANALFRRYMDKLIKSYKYVIMDNEAGMEHLSRRTTRDVDILLIVSDPTQRGLMAAWKIKTLVEELAIGVGEAFLVLNRTSQEQAKALQSRIGELGFDLIGYMPPDSLIEEFDLKGIPLVKLPESSLALRSVFGIMEKLVAEIVTAR